MNFAPRLLFSRSVLSWSLYDFANTIYSAIVVTVYLPLYVTDLVGGNTPVGITATASMIAAGFIIPFLGAWTDRHGNTKKYLFFATLGCVLATAFIAKLPQPLMILIAFFSANLFFHGSLLFYNALLPSVAERSSQGFVSGLGTGLGYLAVLCTLPLAHRVDQAFGRPYVFLLAAVLFFLFALPIFFYVPERKAVLTKHTGFRKTFGVLLKDRNMMLFLVGNFCFVDALNAAILWISVILTKTFLIPQGTLISTILALNASAAISSVILGTLTDRLGAKPIMIFSVLALACAVLSISLIQSFAVAVVLIVVFGGASIAGAWTAGRKLLIELSPPERLGAYFGFYGLTTKVSAIGSSVIAILADAYGFRLAILSALLPIAIAIPCFIAIRKPRTDAIY